MTQDWIEFQINRWNVGHQSKRIDVNKFNSRDSFKKLVERIGEETFVSEIQVSDRFSSNSAG